MLACRLAIFLEKHRMSSSPISQALHEIADQKGLDFEVVLGTLEAALAAAYRKDFGDKNQNIVVQYNPETGAMRVFDVKTVVEDQEIPEEGEDVVVEPQFDEEGNEVRRFNPKTEMMLKDALLTKDDVLLGDVISTELEMHTDFGRMAAQTAKQVITQKLREAERNAVYDEFKSKEHTIMVGTLGRREMRHILVDIGRTTAILPVEEQVRGENYRTGARMKFYITRVGITPRGTEIVLSRAHSELIKDVFTNEIPEVSTGVVKIQGVVREAGNRAKVAVSTDDESIDPIGACIGQRGTRIQTIIQELGGEKIDLIEYSTDPAAYITAALSPAKVNKVEIDEKEKMAFVTVASDQLSLAIGRGGQNVRLAARLTGWKINVKDENGQDDPDAVVSETVPEEKTEEIVTEEATPEKTDSEETA